MLETDALTALPEPSGALNSPLILYHMEVMCGTHDVDAVQSVIDRKCNGDKIKATLLQLSPMIGHQSKLHSRLTAIDGVVVGPCAHFTVA